MKDTELLNPDSDTGQDSNALDILPPRQRQVYELRVGAAGDPPMSNIEVSRKLGISLTAVSKATVRARQRLLREGLISDGNEQLSSEIMDHPWFPIASKMSVEEIEVLEMALEGFSDAQIGREIGIGGRNETRMLRKRLAERFNMTVEELIAQGAQILNLALCKIENLPDSDNTRSKME